HLAAVAVPGVAKLLRRDFLAIHLGDISVAVRIHVGLDAEESAKHNHDDTEDDLGDDAGESVVQCLQHGSLDPVVSIKKWTSIIRRASSFHKKQRRLAAPCSSMAEWTGLEPATPGVTGRYSN